MANPRPQRAAIEFLLARPELPVLSHATAVTATVLRRGTVLRVCAAGISNGDVRHTQFNDVPVAVFCPGDQPGEARVPAGAVCVLDEPVAGGAYQLFYQYGSSSTGWQYRARWAEFTLGLDGSLAQVGGQKTIVNASGEDSLQNLVVLPALGGAYHILYINSVPASPNSCITALTMRRTRMLPQSRNPLMWGRLLSS